jgi:ABC-type transport system involved in cytochrome bd biosynthesis fused ATPase/permease subunit
MLKDAPILLLDEATASLDALTESRVKEALSRSTHRKSLIIVAHRLATVRDADRILVMSDGRIVERGTHETLIAAGGLYAALAAQQSLGAQVSGAASDGRSDGRHYEIGFSREDFNRLADVKYFPKQ